MLARIRANEPLRLYVYPTLVALAGILVVRGYIDADLTDAVVDALGVFILGIPAAELARRKVTPEGKVLDAIATGAQVALDEAHERVEQTFGQPGVQVLEQVQAQLEERVGRHRRAE